LKPRRAIARPRAAAQRGQAMIEAAMMLFFLAFMLMFLVHAMDMFDSLDNVREDLIYKFRKDAETASWGRFKKITKEKDAVVDMPGIYGKLAGGDPLRLPVKLIGYAGCYVGQFQTEYVMRYRYRSISVGE
jgi:hypothetical protein